MAVTPTHDLPGRKQDSDGPSQPSRENRGDDELRKERQGQDTGGDSQPASKSKSMRILGGVGVFVLLALYFVWIGTEMGGHALSGSTEMLAIFGAILLGVLALLAGGVLYRKSAADDDDDGDA